MPTWPQPSIAISPWTGMLYQFHNIDSIIDNQPSTRTHKFGYPLIHLGGDKLYKEKILFQENNTAMQKPSELQTINSAIFQLKVLHDHFTAVPPLIVY